MYVYVCVCVCVYERDDWDTEKHRTKQEKRAAGHLIVDNSAPDLTRLWNLDPCILLLRVAYLWKESSE